MPRIGTIFTLCLCIAGSAAGYLLRPTNAKYGQDVDLANGIPQVIANWRGQPEKYLQVDLIPRGQTTTDAPYDQILMRNYVHAEARIQMVAAWGRSQRQEVKIHRPEVCYEAQGFVPGEVKTVRLNVGPGGSPLDASTFIVDRGAGKREVVLYWIRIGSDISTGAVSTRLKIIRDGLVGDIPDGILIRLSTVADSDQMTSSSLDTLKQFAIDTVATVSLPVRAKLVPL